MPSNNKILLNEIFNLIIEYIDNLQQKDVVKYMPPENLKDEIDLSIGKKGADLTKLNEYVKKYLMYSVKTGNKQFYNQLYAGFNMPAFIGDIITSLTNTSMYTYEVAPVATLMEIELVKKMCGIVGFDSGEGTFVTGGSNANLMAMLCARNRKIKHAKDKGIYNEKNLTAFVSDQAHYSFEKAANLLGIGVNSVIKVKSDKNGVIMPSLLEKEIKQSLSRGENPFIAIATTGTTLLGAYDPIGEMSVIAKKYNLWLHADGSWGGSAVLSRNHKLLLQGLELADSFAWNPHKLMNIPLIDSVILFKEKGTMLKNFASGNTSYIFHEYDNSEYDLGPKSMQCGKRVDSLKLWLAWKMIGDEGYEKRINHLFKIAAYFENKIVDNKYFEIMAPRQSLNVCFRYIPKSAKNINTFNLKMRNELMKLGKSMINYGFIGNKLAIRFVVANPEVTTHDIDKLIINITEVATQLDD